MAGYDFLLKEDGDYLLTEESGRIIIQSAQKTGTRPDRTENLMYIEQVKFIAPYGLELVGGDDHRLDTFLAQQKGILTKQQMEDTLRTVFFAKDRDIVVTTGTKITVGDSDLTESAMVPIGGIILWSGSVASIPTNWQICDGTNGTPDLRDRFVVGAGSTYAVDATGGATTVNIQHSHTSGTLATNSDNHSHTSGTLSTASDDHTHGPTGTLATGGGSSIVLVDNNLDSSTVQVAGVDHAHVTAVKPWSGVTASDSHSHSVNSGSTGGDNHSHTVNSGSTANALSTTQSILPPYYALAYIQRLA